MACGMGINSAPVMAATSAAKVEGSWGTASCALRSILIVASSISESEGTYASYTSPHWCNSWNVLCRRLHHLRQRRPEQADRWRWDMRFWEALDCK